MLIWTRRRTTMMDGSGNKQRYFKAIAKMKISVIQCSIGLLLCHDNAGWTYPTRSSERCWKERKGSTFVDAPSAGRFELSPSREDSQSTHTCIQERSWELGTNTLSRTVTRGMLLPLVVFGTAQSASASASASTIDSQSIGSFHGSTLQHYRQPPSFSLARKQGETQSTSLLDQGI